MAFQRSKHVGGERAEGARQPLQRVRVGPEVGRHAGGLGNRGLSGDEDCDSDPAVLVVNQPADELQQPAGNAHTVRFPAIPVGAEVGDRSWWSAAALPAAAAAEESAGKLCLDQGTKWC